MAKITFSSVLLLLLSSTTNVRGFSGLTSSGISRKSSLTTQSQSPAATSSLFPCRSSVDLAATSAATSISESDEETPELTAAEKEKKKRLEIIRKEGGITAFDTKYGALNLYGILYGIVSIGLGFIWYAALQCTVLFYKVGGSRLDPLRKIPTFLSHVWGITLLYLTGQKIPIENRKIMRDFNKRSDRAAMIVANHNSWMDIPWIGVTIGWKNYKFIAKAELRKVPILGKAIDLGDNIMLDRTNRRSQLNTLKGGIQALKDNLHLVAFPEGTRTRDGRVNKFKNGAFKMAHKNGNPVIPISIVGGSNVNPYYFMFPYRPGLGVAKVIVHDPIESVGKTEEELSIAVRKKIISGLPEEQHPLDE